MCTRYVLLEKHLREALARLGIAAPAKFESRYNIAPNRPVPAVRTATSQSAPEVVDLRWGLVPSWARDDQGPPLVNARLETLAAKPSFRDSLRTRRCLIPATGFYEWETRHGAKFPWLFRRRDEQPFAFAGLWDSWRAPDGTLLESCAFITTTPNDLMRPLHHRMPVMLGPGEFSAWLDPRITEPEKLTPLLRTPEDASVSALALSTYVSNVRHEGPACLTRASVTPPAEPDPQFSLGF
jgi:putative SOS response-associated peptidase YedK